MALRCPAMTWSIGDLSQHDNSARCTYFGQRVERRLDSFQR